ncbi:MAG: HlyD family efflux transporter periplasmic adaptor subunit [Oscillospiraceae bacterium]|nr:HlyD family efflux transporter periplasmic adaptor subunit [Oscillospiraceae bacterium]
MTEQKVKNRGWVKNVAIIFLAVMLVLTFFSNTIMNASLPEAAVQYVQSGAITTQIRGTGTISAKETYEVKTSTSRKVQSVLVSRGQEVKVGDVLILLAAGEGSELKDLQTQLDDAQYSYQQKLINMGGGSSEVTRAQEKLQEAIAKRDANVCTAEEVELAKLRYEAAQDEHQRLSDQLEAAGGYVEGTGADSLDSLKTAANEAKLAMDTAKARYEYENKFIEQLAMTSTNNRYDKTALMDAIAATFGEKKDISVEYYFGDGASNPNLAQEQSNLGINIAKDSYANWDSYKKLPSTDLATISNGYKAVSDAETAYNKAVEAYDKALKQAQPQNAELNQRVKEAQRYMEDMKAEYDEISAKKTTYDAAKDEVVSAETALETLVKTSKLDNLELSRMAKQIQNLKDQIAQLSGGQKDENGNVTGGQIVSEVNGVVKDINVSAGNNTDPANAVMTIEVPDRGYTVSMSVTNEQAQKVTIGDAAEITTGYWGGSDMQGKLVGIRSDTQSQQGSAPGKQLVFDVTGSEIESGTQVSISIGQRSQNYDTLVPNSAIRSDSNGSFVLVIVAKSSPLGNRFVATRVDVTELAKDDVNTAVSGGLSAYDMVLTTATKPVEDGMLVRLPD